MSHETVEASVRWLRDSKLLGDSIEVLWHAGEPLLAGLDFYERADEIVAREMPHTTAWKHVFQTNATLINDDWASFFARTKAQIGISVDGPRDWHDSRRRTWGGKGSFDRIIQAVECLKRHDVPFSTVSVLSKPALENPSRLYDFLHQLGAETHGFNDEEREGAHTTSLQYASTLAREEAEVFYSKLYDIVIRNGTYGKIREIGNALVAFHSVAKGGQNSVVSGKIPSDMSDPFRILNVAFDGTFSTFAPELLGHQVNGVGQFVFGNVHDDALADVILSKKFQLARQLIESGVDQCRAACKYYAICGGGSPSNKYFENGRLDSTITMFCQLSIMAPLNVVLAKLENEQALNSRHGELVLENRTG